ncbi:uncharacterized protein LOC111692564 [Anoplophora glabripennis]|uniref:uncharacterized protein LOC111692421 n=1 Tax=Anoplophora glabripennis TaxID=217634 RepID=UPI000C784257|nr:uncharacterized protein LOC111692421 [Anoplophora glabripennis]XP_023312385.1 uncharacterized protein LOC111692564 [Anoplophora glabripennis]
MEKRGDLVVEIAEADSTTYPLHSPTRQWSSSWSDSTVTMYGEDMEDDNQQQQPDSTTSPERSGSTTPDNLNVNLMEGRVPSPEGSESAVSDDLMLDVALGRLEEWVNMVREQRDRAEGDDENVEDMN